MKTEGLTTRRTGHRPNDSLQNISGLKIQNSPQKIHMVAEPSRPATIPTTRSDDSLLDVVEVDVVYRLVALSLADIDVLLLLPLPL